MNIDEPVDKNPPHFGGNLLLLNKAMLVRISARSIAFAREVCLLFILQGFLTAVNILNNRLRVFEILEVHHVRIIVTLRHFATQIILVHRLLIFHLMN